MSPLAARAARLGARLEALRRTHGGGPDSDPVGLVRKVAGRPGAGRADVEVAGLVAAGLALGNVATIRAKVADAFARMDAGGGPAAFALRAARDPAAARRALRGFRHRFFVGRDLAGLLAGAGRLLDRHGTLGAAFRAVDGGEADVAPALGRFVEALGLRPGFPVFPSPAAGSAAKRAFLYARWMVRRDDVDLGLWDVDPARLVLPLDTHVGRLARLLGLARRASNDLAAAREATSALARFDPADPVKYDFALARLGIVDGCRGRWFAPVCSRCPLVDVCAAALQGRSRSAPRRALPLAA